MLYGKIYADFLHYCHRVRLAGPWRRFAKNTDFWMLPQDTTAIPAALQEKYSVKDLVGSGVVTNRFAVPAKGHFPVHTEDAELLVNPILSGLYSRILPLRTVPQCDPFDLLVDDGTTSGQLPVRATMHDHRLKKAIPKAGFLCLTFSMADLMAFQAAGIPATLAKGLEKLTRKTVMELTSSLGLGTSGGSTPYSHKPAVTPPGSALPVQEGLAHETQAPSPTDHYASNEAPNSLPGAPPRLFLVGWSPSQLSLNRPNELDEVHRNLANISRFLGIDFNDVFVWRPTAVDLQRITFCLKNGNRKEVRRAIVTSLRGSAEPVGRANGELVNRPHSLLEAQSRFREVLLRPGSKAGDRRRRLQQYQHSIASTLVKPLLQLAIDEPDPKRRSQLAALAGLNQVLYPAVELYLANQEKEVVKRGLGADGQGPSVRDLMKMFDAVSKLTKEDE